MVRNSLAKHGYTLPDLMRAWREVQNPTFSDTGTEREFLFLDSPNDKVVPLDEIEQCIGGMKLAGIKAVIRKHSSGSHVSVALRGLLIRINWRSRGGG